MTKISDQNNYQDLINSIGKALEIGRQKAYKAVDNILVQTYWEVGRLVVEFE